MRSASALLELLDPSAFHCPRDPLLNTVVPWMRATEGQKKSINFMARQHSSESVTSS